MRAGTGLRVTACMVYIGAVLLFFLLPFQGLLLHGAEAFVIAAGYALLIVWSVITVLGGRSMRFVTILALFALMVTLVVPTWSSRLWEAMPPSHSPRGHAFELGMVDELNVPLSLITVLSLLVAAVLGGVRAGMRRGRHAKARSTSNEETAA